MFEQARKKKKTRFFNKRNVIGLVIAFVMISSLLAAWQGSYTPLDDYNDYKFKSTDVYGAGGAGGSGRSAGNVLAKIDDNWINFEYHPSSLENIEVPENGLAMLRDSKMIYLSFDPYDKLIKDVELARIELTQSFLDEFFIYPSVGVIANHSLYQQFPVIECENATQFIPVVILTSHNETLISQQGNCVYLYAADSISFKPLIDRIRYGLYSVMK